MVDRRRVSIPPAIAVSGAAVSATWWAGGPEVGVPAFLVWAVAVLPPSLLAYRLGRVALITDSKLKVRSPVLDIDVKPDEREGDRETGGADE